MSDRIVAALILGIAAVVGAALLGGRYSTSPMQQGGVYVVDRFTGNVQFCVPRECVPVGHKAPDPDNRSLEEFLLGKKKGD